MIIKFEKIYIFISKLLIKLAKYINKERIQHNTLQNQLLYNELELKSNSLNYLKN